MGKYDPSRCKFIFEIGIHRFFREVTNRDARSTLLIAVEMVDFNLFNGVIGIDCRLRR
jgi:hypothetical protein